MFDFRECYILFLFAAINLRETVTMFSSLNLANSKWGVAEDQGMVGKEVILDVNGNTRSKVIVEQPQTNLL